MAGNGCPDSRLEAQEALDSSGWNSSALNPSGWNSSGSRDVLGGFLGDVLGDFLGDVLGVHADYHAASRNSGVS